MKNILAVFKQRPVAEATVLIMIIAVLTAFATNVRHEREAVFQAGEQGRVLVIDAGHGGIDGGAICADGSRESDINLAIALKLEALCSFYGCDYVMTRCDDSRASNVFNYSEHEELVYRVDLVKSFEAPVLLSIHQNYYPTAQPSGAQVIYSGNGHSEELGVMMHENIVSSLEPENRRVVQPDKNKIYVLSNVDCPAILVECGFVSNHSDITKLKDPSYQTALSTVMLSTYIQYLANTASSAEATIRELV